jgi:mRNA interferase RelE/StbE
MYELLYKKKVIKALAIINDPYYTNIIEDIDSLAENPRPHAYKKLTARDGYRIPVGTHRIIYDKYNIAKTQKLYYKATIIFISLQLLFYFVILLL